jgi:hypothetical protein
VNLRLKKLRRERHLIDKAINALTQLSKGRESRARRASRI